MKKCSQCGTLNDESNYKKYSRVCHSCTLLNQREYRKINKNECTYKYEKTKRGFLMREYRNMQSRVTGVQKKKAHLYLGKELLPREMFYAWAMASPFFHNLFTQWEYSKYDRRFCPSVDRVNSDKGYELSNMEWVTHSENSRRGSLSAKRNKLFAR